MGVVKAKVVSASSANGGRTPAARSPNYPAIDLKQSLDLARKIFDASARGRHSVNEQLAAEYIGYSGPNGASKVKLSALKKFGLLIGDNQNLLLSSDARTIFEHFDTGVHDSELANTISRCTLRPVVFRAIFDEYGDHLPADNIVRLSLSKRNYSPEASVQIIRLYRATLAFAAQFNGGKVSSGSNRDEEDEDSEEHVSIENDAIAVGRPKAGHEKSATRTLTEVATDTTSVLRFQIAGDCVAEVTFTGRVTQKGIGKLIQLLDVSKDTYPNSDQKFVMESVISEE